MQRMQRFFGVLFLILSTAVLPAAPVRSAGGDIHLTIRTPSYTLDAGGLAVPGFAANDVPGAPNLPVWTTVVELPEGAAWSLAWTAPEEQVWTIEAPLPAVPVPELALDRPSNEVSADELADLATLADRPDPAIYGKAAFYPAAPVQAGSLAIQAGRRLLPVRVFPFQVNPVTGELRYRSHIEVTIHLSPGGAASPQTRGAETGSPSADTSIPGLRIRTGERGMHKLTYDALSAADVPVASLNPASLAMSYLGEPIDIEVTGAADGKFDPGDAVIFYAEPYVGRYMKQNVYRLTWSGAAGARIGTRSGSPSLAQPAITTIRQRAHIEYDRVYYGTYELPRDADHFFDNPLFPNSTATTAVLTYTLALDDVLPQGNAQLLVSLHGGLALGGRDPDQSVALRLNGAALGAYQWDGSVTHVISETVPAATLKSGANNKLAIEAALSQLPGINLYWVSPDWAELAYPATADAENDRLFIEAVIWREMPVTQHLLYLPLILSAASPQAMIATAGTAGGDVGAGGFTAPGIRVYDVSDPRRPVRLTGVQETSSGGGYAAVFGGGQPDSSSYLATDTGLLAPLAIEVDAPSALRSPSNAADYIAVVHRSLWDAVQPLLDHRAAEGLRIVKVDIQDVYDEFSGGRLDPEALRSFLTYAYHNWNGGGPRPVYVLLVGDGHYDFKGSLRPDLPNLIPPYLLDIDPYIGETAADNRFASVDGDADFLPDMAIGRIPAKTPADVTAVVDKILAYEKSAPAGAWQKRTVFVADNKDDADGNFHLMSDQTRMTLPALYETQSIYYKANAATDTTAEMEAAIKAAFDSGALYLQWFGHASRTFWGADRIWELNDPPKLLVNTVWPFTASYSCWSGYFINVIGSGQYGGSEQSLGEAMLLAPKKSSLADLSPTGLHVGGALIALDQRLADALFTQRIDRVGLAVDAAKLAYFNQAGGALDLIDTQVLLGDPATRLKLP